MVFVQLKGCGMLWWFWPSQMLDSVRRCKTLILGPTSQSRQVHAVTRPVPGNLKMKVGWGVGQSLTPTKTFRTGRSLECIDFELV